MRMPALRPSRPDVYDALQHNSAVALGTQGSKAFAGSRYRNDGPWILRYIGCGRSGRYHGLGRGGSGHRMRWEWTLMIIYQGCAMDTPVVGCGWSGRHGWAIDAPVVGW